MKRHLFISGLIICCVAVQAQNMKLSADFVQTKKSAIFVEETIQKGYMRFSSPDSLTWCYTYPTRMEVKMDGKSGNALAGIKDMIVSIVKGNFDSKQKDFTVKSEPAENGTTKVTVTPRSSRSRSIFKSMEIFTQKDVRIADRIVIYEQNEDITTIKFSNQKLNIE